MRVTSPVSARRVGSGSVDHVGAPGDGRGVFSGNSCSCGFGGRRDGLGMTISLVVIAKPYPSGLLDLIVQPTPRQNLGKKRSKLGERRSRHHWLRGAPHWPACRRVQHPQGKLLDPNGRHPVEAAASESRAAALNHLVNANPQAEPCVPAIGDDRVVAKAAAIPWFVGLLS